MSYILQMRMDNVDGMLERVLGVVRYRGHRLMRLTANPTPDGSRMDVTLALDEGKAGAHIRHHLQKLFDLESVAVYSEVPHPSVPRMLAN